jgi:hypothetical protein
VWNPPRRRPWAANLPTPDFMIVIREIGQNAAFMQGTCSFHHKHLGICQSKKVILMWILYDFVKI